MKTETHGKQRPQRLTDPMLGPVWTRVGCEWCGVVGRYDTKTIAQLHADKHNRKTGAK